MTDLKKEIARLETMSYEDKFEGIVKVALQRNELIELLSGEEEYVYDTAGKAWLAPSPCFGPDANVIDITRVAFMVNRLYKETKDENIKSTLVDGLAVMLNGTPIQLYYAISIYCYLAGLEYDRSSAFAGYYVNKYSFAQDFLPTVVSAVKSRKKELLETKIDYIGSLENLYVWCELRSKDLIRYGFSSITEE